MAHRFPSIYVLVLSDFLGLSLFLSPLQTAGEKNGTELNHANNY